MSRMHSLCEKIAEKCKKHGTPEPKFGEKFEDALEKILELVEHLEKEIEEINQYYWS
jgi:hypothetical protein